MKWYKITEEDLNILRNAINELSGISGVKFTHVYPILNHLDKQVVAIVDAPTQPEPIPLDKVLIQEITDDVSIGEDTTVK